MNKQKAYEFFTEKGKKGSRYKKDVIKLSNGDTIALNKLERTWEFGSSSGTSIGTKQTRINETIQAIYLAIRYKKKSDIIPEDILEFIEDYNKDSEYALSIYRKIGSNAKVTIEDLDIQRGWMDTHLKIANLLFDYLGDENHYVFYQAFFDGEESVPKTMRNKFYRLIEELTNVDVDIAKWNPSDIFIVNEEKEIEIIERLNVCNDLEELNIVMDYYFEKKYLVGISLKKLNLSKDVKFIVNKEQKSDFKYLKASASLVPTASMSVNIHVEAESTIPTTKEQVMVARIFTGEKESDIMLEIKGKESMYGKVGMSFLNETLKRAGIGTIPSYSEIGDLSNEEITEEINNYYDKLEMGKTQTKNKRYDISESRSRLISKLQSLALVDMLESNRNVRYFKKGFIGTIMSLFKKTTKTDYVVKQLFYYAYAMGNEIFLNCKYFRISNINQK